jgi:hypothetical protein
VSSRTEEVGKTILIGITREFAAGEVDLEQFAGRIVGFSAGENNLAIIACTDGVERTYPWDHRALSPAQPGEYRLRSTGEVIENPDWLMQWTVRNEN